MTPRRPRSIAILVTTFNRNPRLLRLVGQLQGFIAEYRGPNRYFVCVADSNPRNLQLRLPAGVSYVVNPGSGFDDNLLAAFRALCGATDHVFAMGDDDLCNVFANPLVVIDAGLAAGDRDVVLFNHVSYREEGDLHLGDRYYRVGETVNLALDPMSILGWRLPRYTAIAYRTAFVEALLPALAAFRGTLHAYAAPVLIAASARRFTFFDYPLCLFDRGDKEDGAWESTGEVVAGLSRFLEAIEPHVPAAHFDRMRLGFQHNYFDRPMGAGGVVAMPAAASSDALAAAAPASSSLETA